MNKFILHVAHTRTNTYVSWNHLALKSNIFIYENKLLIPQNYTK